MKLILIAFTVAILLPLISFAQSNFKPGYVISLKGDTLKGSVDYKEWEKNPGQVTFKNGSGAEQKFTPQNAKAFVVTGFEYYESGMVHISLDPADATLAGTMLDTSYRADTVFLRTLIKGRYFTLYSYSDNIKTRFYVREPGGAQPQELVYHVYNSESGVRRVSRYQGQLLYIAQKNNLSNAKLQATLSQLQYTDNDMLKAAAAINGSDPSQLKSVSKIGTRFFAGAGVNYNGMSFTGDVEFPNNYSVFPKISAGIDAFTNKNVQSLYLRIEAAFSGDRHTSHNGYQKSELKVDQYTASIIPQIYYNFYNGQKVKVFAGGGLSLNYSAYPTRYYITLGGIDVTPIKQNNFPDYYKFWESVVIKAGISINNHIEICAGYTPPTTITDNYLAFDGRVTSYQAGVNFLFGVKK
jgi:hypothetical protein